uniref:Uncharacterized protein n=1 Tax=Rhizophora mucronata TaxID=61149 RepID=A0A2P2Q8A1_RHIMU
MNFNHRVKSINVTHKIDILSQDNTKVMGKKEKQRFSFHEQVHNSQIGGEK